MALGSKSVRNAPPEPDPLLDAFWERGLILLGDKVQQEYGLKTPIFIDLRHKLYDDLEILCALGAGLHRKLVSIIEAESPSGAKPQQVIGIPDTATPLALAAAMASRSSSLPLIYGQMRKKPAAYPGGEWGVSAYMGTRDLNREITLIDDVMASGRTKLWAMDQLAKDGLRIQRILVVVDRQQGGDAVVAGKGCPSHSLYQIAEMIDYYAASGKVDERTARQARDHLQAKQFK